MWFAILSGWWLGLGSSGHCLGMCGPIAIALPFRDEFGRMNWGKYQIYQLGRILTYISIGIVIGLVGKAITWQGFGNWLSILSGLFLIILALNQTIWNQKKQYSGLSNWISSIWKKTFQSKYTISYLFAGAANGLLPCGMVYAAAIAALGTGDGLGSVALMAGFGLGTLPVFFLLPSFSKIISKYPRVWRSFVPIALALTGIWLIARGLPSLFPADHCAPESITPMCWD